MTPKPEYPNVMPTELGQSLGDRLKKSMRHSGLSVGDMADFLEVHRNTVSGWLADRSKPMPIFLRTWADRTHVPLEWIRDGDWPACEEFERQPASARKAPARKAPTKQAQPARKAPAKRVQPAKTARRRTAG